MAQMPNAGEEQAKVRIRRRRPGDRVVEVSEPRPLSGRELYSQHEALVAVGASPSFRAAWLNRELDRWGIPRVDDDEGGRDGRDDRAPGVPLMPAVYGKATCPDCGKVRACYYPMERLSGRRRREMWMRFRVHPSSYYYADCPGSGKVVDDVWVIEMPPEPWS